MRRRGKTSKHGAGIEQTPYLVCLIVSMNESMSYPSYPYPQYPFGVGVQNQPYFPVPTAPPPRPPVRVVLPPPPQPNCIHVAWFVLVVLVLLGCVGGVVYYLIH